MNYLFGALLVITSNIIIGVANIFDGQLTRKTFSSVWSIVIANGFVLIPILPIMFFILRPEAITKPQFFILLIISTVEFFYQFPYYSALRHADTSVIASLFSIGKILIPIFAYFIVGEKLSLLQYIGFIIIVLCSFAVTFKKVSLKPSKALLYMIPVVIILAFSSTLSKYGLNQIEWKTFYFYKYALSAPFYFFTFFIIKSARSEVISFLKSPFKKSYAPLYVQNIATWVSGIFSTLALSLLPITIVKAFGSFHALIVHFIASKGSKKLGVDNAEKLSKNRILLFILIGIGVFLTFQK
ncbi:MAG: EamA family transporter [Minisyncoccia bacterium]